MSPAQPAVIRPPTGAGWARLPGRLLDALTSPVDPDRYLELLGPMLVVNEARAQVVAVQQQTPDTVTLTLRASRAWRGHQAGQHVRLSVEIDGVRHTRCYSPANASTGGRLIEVTARRHQDGVVSPALAGLRAGSVLHLARRAEGGFVLPPHPPERLLLISGGSGITPVMSMLRTLVAQGHRGEVAFLHYARDREHELYRDELARLEKAASGLKVAVVHTRDTGTSDLRGHFGPAHLQAMAPWYAGAPAFLCGPPALTAAITAFYAGQDRADLLTVERFSLDADQAGQPAPAGGGTGHITFSASGIRVPNSGQPLLKQAEAAGLNLEFGCRMGLCQGCLQLKRSGVVRNHVTGETRSGQDQDVWTCVGVPVGDVDLNV